MTFRHRPMRREDVGECVKIVASHPFIGPQHGSSLGDLGRVWLGLLGREAFRAVVFEHAKDSQVRGIGVGASVFVSDEFLRELKTPPFFWVGPELINRTNRGAVCLGGDGRENRTMRSLEGTAETVSGVRGCR